MYRCFLNIVFTASLLMVVCTLKSQNLSPDEIIKSIKRAGNYASESLIDQEGKSKCDYDIISGEWKVYEPLWHTGQVIWGLLHAFDVTQDSQYLHTAKRAGDWWRNQQFTNHPALNGFVKGFHFGEVEDHLINFTTLSVTTEPIVTVRCLKNYPNAFAKF